MKKTFTLAIALSLALVAGCGKKDDTAKKTEATPADKAPAASPSPTAPVAPAPPDKLMDVAETPAGSPKECADARAIYVKIHDCAKLDEKMRAQLVKTWNDMAEQTLKRWGDANEHDRAFIIDTCKKLPETAGMLVQDC
ncbi:MAG TPA: hypothetical protein VMZ53_02550 [Kofleriaceae bacterium]|nr:hypothetical protein [Kofleriaceae bacterium]